MIGIGISTKDNNSSDDNSVSSVDDIEGDFTYTATPTSIIDDLSIPGAFAQRLQCSNKRCCNDTECSNYRDIDIGELPIRVFSSLSLFTDLFVPFSHSMV